MASSSLILPGHALLVITEQKHSIKYESSGFQPPEAGLM